MTEETAVADSTLYSLDQLSKLLGPPPPDLLPSVVNARTREAFIEAGRKIASNRITTDCARVYGKAHQFWQQATEAQKFLLTGVSPEFLALGVQQANEADALWRDAQADTKVSAAEHKTREAGLRAEMTHGYGLNDLAETTLRNVAGKDPEQVALVDGVCGAAPDADTLARSLRGKAKLATTFLGFREGPVAVRVRVARLTDQLPKTLETTAAKVEEAGKLLHAAVRRGMDQGELDLLDGVNLYLLAEVIRVFDAAHNMDGTIPRLQPIATRRALGRGSHKKAGEPA